MCEFNSSNNAGKGTAKSPSAKYKEIKGKLKYKIRGIKKNNLGPYLVVLVLTIVTITYIAFRVTSNKSETKQPGYYSNYSTYSTQQKETAAERITTAPTTTYKGNTSNTNKKGKSPYKQDEYNAKDYGDAEDFYEDNYDDFDSYEDAEDYYDDYGE